ncbi:TCP-1/cpn60 chaperonin family protein [archaeon]|nr:TCP-1/cpn60 chaperonin family protein [archaeon]
MVNQPIFILPENTQRLLGKDAQRVNISAAKLVAETVKTTLGPKGMDKMIVDSLGDVIVTNDGVTILKEMQIEHPAAKMIVEVAKTQEEQVGDGTTTAAILAGEFLKNAERLLDEQIHPTVITKGYRLASIKAQEILEKLAERVSFDNKEMLYNIAITAMTGKGAESSKEALAELAVNAVQQVMENGKALLDDIKIEKKEGGGIEDSELIKGIILDKERVSAGMPKTIKDAKIALLDAAIEVKSTEIDAKIQLTDPAQLQAFLSQEEKILKDMVDKITNSGATVVFCQKGIDDVAQYLLAKKGIYAARRIKKSDMEKLERATSGRIVSKISELDTSCLGSAGIVEEMKFGDEDMTYVRECKNPKAVTILIRGGTEHVINEVERAMQDALGDIIATLNNKGVVGGAGAVEIELAKELKGFANSLSGREQLAVNAFAEAIEVIPKTLAENAGLDPIDILARLKSEHNKGNKWAGINVFDGAVIDAWKEGIIEPLKIKTQAIKSASEVAGLILRIDDVIAGSGSKESRMPQMPPGGMGEY